MVANGYHTLIAVLSLSLELLKKPSNPAKKGRYFSYLTEISFQLKKSIIIHSLNSTEKKLVSRSNEKSYIFIYHVKLL